MLPSRMVITVLNQAVSLSDIFSAFLEAMATAASHDPSATGAVINAVGVSEDTALKMHGLAAINTPSMLS